MDPSDGTLREILGTNKKYLGNFRYIQGIFDIFEEFLRYLENITTDWKKFWVICEMFERNFKGLRGK